MGTGSKNEIYNEIQYQGGNQVEGSPGARVILMFCGQGSQYTGMGIDFLDKNKNYLKYFDISSSIIGEDILSILKNENGMGSCLEKTLYSQIAIYTLSCALNDYLFKEKGINASLVKNTIGHSLGDYSALYSSGAYDFKTGAGIVAFRGTLMAEAAGIPHGRMMMAAVLGAGIEIVSKVLKSYADRVFIANMNDYSQVVISGYEDDVIEAGKEIKSSGAGRVVPLKVNIASHCPLMKGASVKLEKYLNDNTAGFNDMEINFFSSTMAAEIKKDQVKQMLVSQLTGPVRWVDSIEKIIKALVRKPVTRNGENAVFIEVGPGKVLSGLVRRISSQMGMEEYIKIFNTDSLEDIERIII